MPTLLFNNFTGHTIHIQFPNEKKTIRVKKTKWLELPNGSYEIIVCARLFWFQKKCQVTHVSIERADRILSIYLDPLLKLYLYPTQQHPFRTLMFIVLFGGLYFVISKLGDFQTPVGTLSFSSLYVALAVILLVFMAVIEILAFLRIGTIKNVFEIPNTNLP